MARTSKTTPEVPLPNQVCGAEIPVPGAASNALCALKPGHEGDHDRFPTPAGAEIREGVPKVSPLREETGEEIAQRVFGNDLTKRPVVAKLARIMGALPDLQPEGRNAHFNYSFIKDTQISGALRGRLARENLMIIPDVVDESWVETKTSRGGTSWVTKLKVNFTVIDADSGDQVSGHGFGYGDDSGDKGANKAFTAALKYWLIKLFEIGGEDIESDQRADERAAGRESGASAQPHISVQGAEITGIARGGQSDRITATQLRAIFALYKDLGLTPERFADVLEFELDRKVAGLEEAADAGPVLNTYLKALTSDQAGKIITILTEMKDDESNAVAEATLPDDIGAK